MSTLRDYQQKASEHPRARELTGQRFGKLTVLSMVRTDKLRGRVWLCQCDCGHKCERTSGKLRDKHNPNVSCGCGAKESIRKAAAAAVKVTTKFSHPLKLKIKWLYRNMVCRCYDPKNNRYADYGGRGITVCEEWRKDRYAFYRWCLENNIQGGLQLDRKDNAGPYCPSNCQFSDGYQQANNTRKNVFVTANGQTMTIAQWARHLGVKYGAVQHRVDRGWSPERIVTQPFRCQH